MAAAEKLIPFNFNRRKPRPHDVLVDILYCGICHTDLHFVRNDRGMSIYPFVPGHEIVGRVSQIGDHVHKFKVGDTVGIGCLVDSILLSFSNWARMSENTLCAFEPEDPYFDPMLIAK